MGHVISYQQAQTSSDNVQGIKNKCDILEVDGLNRAACQNKRAMRPRIAHRSPGSWLQFCLVEQNGLCKYARGHFEK